MVPNLMGFMVDQAMSSESLVVFCRILLLFGPWMLIMPNLSVTSSTVTSLQAKGILSKICLAGVY